MTLTLRKAVETEAAGLSALHKQAFAQLFERGWSESEMASLMEYDGVDCFVAERPREAGGRDVVGLLFVRKVLDEAEILTFAVHTTMQGNGVGRFLLSSVMECLLLDGIKKVFLEVRKDNFSAIKLYSSYGFINDRIRKDYYQTELGERIDALNYIFDCDQINVN